MKKQKEVVEAAIFMHVEIGYTQANVGIINGYLIVGEKKTI